MINGEPRLVHRISYVVPAATGPSNNVKMGAYNYGTDFGAMDVAFSGGSSTMNNTNVKTVDLNHSTSGSTAYSFAGTRNIHKEINGPVIRSTMPIILVVRSSTCTELCRRTAFVFSANYADAFWGGSTMIFGDGGSTFYPMVSLNVAVHEVSLDVTITGCTDDACSYLHQSFAPTTSAYDCRPDATGNSENCGVANPVADIYHIGVRGYSAATGVTMRWIYQMNK
jgi:hypothetical protein